jgi:hypothetical protein
MTPIRWSAILKAKNASQPRRSPTMRIGLNYITALLLAGAASMAIAVAPRGLALPTTAVPAGIADPPRTAPITGGVTGIT